MPHRVIAVIWCDLETNGLGLPSRLMNSFAGEVLLLRVLRRALKCPAYERVVLLARPKDAGRLKGLALPERCEILEADVPDVPQRDWLRRARKWSLDGWRGGLGWASAFDEEGPPAALWAACCYFKADAVVRLPSHAPFLDPGLGAALVDLHLRRRGTFQFTFCQAPPGLVGEAYHPEFIETMMKGKFSPRNVLMIRPNQEGMDPQRSECHLDAGEKVRNAPYRVSCESPRLWKLCEAIDAGGKDLDAEGMVGFLDTHPDLWRGAVPREILADPAGSDGTVLDPAVWSAWLKGLEKAGDSTVTLGVHGEPLAHPRWREFLQGAYGLHLRTSGSRLDAATVETLLQSPLDVITVGLDAPQAQEGLEHLLAARKEKNVTLPLVALEFALRQDTEGDLVAWWKQWLDKVDWPLVRGSAIPLAPPNRRPCAKLSRLLYVRPDGRVMPCAEDRSDAPGLGSIARDPLEALWSGRPLGVLRESHAAGRWPESAPPCSLCGEWAWV